MRDVRPGCNPEKQLGSACRPRLQAQAGRARKAERAFMQSAHFSQPKPEVPSPTGAPLTIETTKEIQNRKAFSWNETKKETPFCANLAELDKERNVVGIALQMHVTAAEFLLGPTWSATTSGTGLALVLAVLWRL